ncbi:DEAD-box ATP-dependent RNA helicase CshE-like isoform X3 [Bolinopsis microptera]|uniref:DEAD-box ATP-dependent RNA helicase CshE-like isoform X3 n=1 Tax=Bolinopsis microptera TaxID=2820187 RepID=UPI003079C593
MQHVRTIFRLQAHYQAIYCCGRHLTDGHVTGGHVTGLTSSLPHSEAVSNRHITPASDLNIKIYQPSYNDELKDIFGENKREHKEKVNFADFKSLQPELRERLKELGYEKPLPVQHRTLEATLRGKDAVIKSVTGSGKTLAFIIPLLNKVGAQRIGEERGRAPQAVIVAPTRELCRQIASVLEEFIGPERVSLMTAGLVKVKKQARQARLESKDIIVATPGRTMQLISNNIIRPKSLKFLVLDEADELLHDLFYQHMRWILDNSNPSKQMIVTTATVPSNVQFVIDRYMKYHEYIDLGAASVSLPEHIKHKAVLYDVGVFKRCLKWVLKNEHGSCSMLFVKHKDDCSRVTELVRSFGYSVKYINSDVPENSRVRVMMVALREAS